MTHSRVFLSLAFALCLFWLAACGAGRQADPAEALMATLEAEAGGMQPTVQVLAATRAALQTRSAIPTATVTPMAEPITGGDGLNTTLIWNITDFGLGAGGGIHDLLTTAEAHHFLFEGSAGAEVNIHVNSAGPGSLPQFTLLDSNGNILGHAAAQGSAMGAEMTVTLPAEGIYHIRVSALTPGRYALGMTLQP